MVVRHARSAELAPVMTVFDSGNLEVDPEQVRNAAADGRLLVAAEDGRVLGALLLEPDRCRGSGEIEAIAVRPGRRGQGLGTALVQAAAARHDRLVARFDPGVRPFWRSLGFDIETADEPERALGRLDGSPSID